MNFFDSLKKNLKKRKKISSFGVIFLSFILFFPLFTQAGFLDFVSSPILTSVATLTNLWLKLMSWLVGFAGLILNMVLDYTVVNMKTHIAEMGSINLVWKTIRDLANMSFIFVLLYASIRTILGDSKIAKQTIKNIIIVALFVNFSLFGTKLLIDASNLATMMFYSEIAPNAGTNQYLTGLSTSFVNPLKIQSLYDVTTGETTSYGQIFIVGFMGSIFLIVVAFVFLAVSFFFLTRFVVLIVVLMFSPLAFASFMLPALHPYGKKWREALQSQLIFAPVFMLFAWVTIAVINDTSFLAGLNAGKLREGLVGAGSGDKPFQPNGSGLTLIVNFFIAIGLMLTALTTSKELSSKAHPVIAKMNGWAADKARAGMGFATVGMAGRLARGTVGREALDRSNNKALQERALKGGPGGYMARLDLAASKKLAKSSFDARSNMKGFGPAQKGGFAGDVKKKEEALQEGVKNLKMSDAEKELQDEMKVKANKNIESAKENLTSERERLTLLSDTAVAKSPELVAAEAAEAAASSLPVIEPFDPSTETESEYAERKSKVEEEAALKAAAARAEAQRLRDEHELKKQTFVDTELATANQRLKDAQKELETANKFDPGQKRIDSVLADKNKKIETLEGKKSITIPFINKKIWKPSTDRVFMVGEIKREVGDAPAVIRKAAKKKTEEEEALEAWKKLAAKEEKKKKEEEEAASGGTSTPPPAAPPPAAPTP